MPVHSGRVDMALVGEEHGAAAARPAAYDVQILDFNLNLNLIGPISPIYFMIDKTFE